MGAYFRKNKKRVGLALLPFGLLLVVSIINPAKTNAATNTPVAGTYPIAGQSEVLNAGGGTVNSNARPWFAVGTGAYSGTYSYAKVYVPNSSATATLTIQQGGGVCSIDVGAPSVQYSAFSLDNNETFLSPVANLVDNTSNAGACGDRTMTLRNGVSANGGAVAGHGGYRVYYIEAFILPAAGDNEKSFFLSVNNGGQIGISRSVRGYGGNQNGFGIYQRDIGSGGGGCNSAGQPAAAPCMWNFEFQFAPRCGEASNAPKDWRIFDYDNGVYTPPAGGGPANAAVLQRDVRGGSYTWATTDTWSGASLGGNAVTTTHRFTADDGYRYKLRFNQVNWHNTLQIEVPYDSFDASQSIVCYLAVCSGVNPTAASATINSSRSFDVTFTNAGAHALDAGDDLRMTQGGNVTNIANPGFGAGSSHTFNITVARGSPGTYTFIMQMMHNGVPLSEPPSNHCTYTLTVRAPTILDADCNNSPQNRSVNADYGAFNVTFAVSNTGNEDWSNGNYRLADLGPIPLNPAAGGFYALHWQVEGTANTVPPVFPHRSDTFDLGVPAGLSVGDHTFNFQMTRRDTLPSGTVIRYFGQVCTMNIHVNQVKPQAAAIWEANCKNLRGTVHFANAINPTPAGSGPVFSVYQNGSYIGNTQVFNLTTEPDGVTPGGPAPVNDWYFANNPFNPDPPGTPGGRGVGIRLWPHYSYELVMFWYAADDGSYSPMSARFGLNAGNPCLTASCSLGSSGQPEPGESQPLGAIGVTYVNYTTQPYPDYTTTVSWSNPPLLLTNTSTGFPYFPVFTNTPTQRVDSTPIFSGMNPVSVTTNTSGTIQIVSRFTGAGLSEIMPGTPCDIIIKAYTKPFMKAFGGDVSAGGGFNTVVGTNNCTTASPIVGNIKTYANSEPANSGVRKRAGSSTEFGVFLSGVITNDNPTGNRKGFYSNLPFPGPYNTLVNPTTFANSGVPLWGGGFITHCIYDYYDAFAPLTTFVPAANAVINNITDRIDGYNLNGVARLSVSTGGTPISTHQTVVINGDVYLGSDIRYSDWTWTNANPQPPLVTIIAKGNIYISNNVKRLDGVYVAQPDAGGVGGQVYTCFDDAAGLVPSSISILGCTNTLDVNGSLIAKHIHFDRISGTLRTAALGPIEVYTSVAPTRVSAEKFNFTPEALMTPATIKTGGGSSSSAIKLDSLISLPPLF